MAKQTKLSSFFKVPAPTTLPLKQKLNNITESMPKKRTLTTSETTNDGSKMSKENSPVKLAATKNVPAKVISLEAESNGLIRNFGQSWLTALEKEFKKDYFIGLSKFVKQERNKFTVYPKSEDVFAWTTACRLNDVKVVILGQDPYHGPNQAHGLCFSVPSDVRTPPSLVNMYKELSGDIPEFQTPNHGYLMGWARQGVLLLNAVLTVRAGAANSHKDKGWEKLTDAVIQHLNQKKTNLVFILWGAYAQKKGAHIDKRKHCILQGVHPSPLSAHRGFFGCKHFSQTNDYLTSHKKSPIDWSYLPEQL